jgi:hypothetical protein
MMVIAMVVISGELEPTPSFRQFQFPKQVHRAEQTQGAVHRGQRHTLIGTQQALMNFLGTEMSAFTKPLKQSQNTLSLRREPLATAVQPAAQCLSWLIRRRHGRHQQTTAPFSTVTPIAK